MFSSDTNKNHSKKVIDFETVMIDFKAELYIL